MTGNILEHLRKIDVANRLGKLKNEQEHQQKTEQFLQSGVAFASSRKSLEEVFYSALGQLFDCITVTKDGEPVLLEGGPYKGSWLESTGTINSEILSRFIPSVSQATFSLFSRFQREDGLIPYKWTKDGPSYRQIQMVTPLSRSVWNHYRMNGHDRGFLRQMYNAMKGFDEWLARHRNTRKTNCVEAFGTFDTGHDLSPRFWHVPDRPHGGDAACYDPDSPILPFLAPDLTANIYCQRKYLHQIAVELGKESEHWERQAAESLGGLMKNCYDQTDAFFYDVDNNGQFVRVQSDVLLRVLACEVGDHAFFERALERYLLNTRKFFAKYPFTSIAMDDPRFDPFSDHNSWAGPTNFLTLIRAPHAFEYHHHFVELNWVMLPILSTLSRMDCFPQCVDPWTGEPGYTDTYSPAILCLFDFLERICGIMPRPDGEVWFTGLIPYAVDHGEEGENETGYSRTVEKTRFELVNTDKEASIYRNGQLLYRFPHGVRVVTDREGCLLSIIGMTVRKVEGTIYYKGERFPFTVKGNEKLLFANGTFQGAGSGNIVMPSY